MVFCKYENIDWKHTHTHTHTDYTVYIYIHSCTLGLPFSVSLNAVALLLRKPPSIRTSHDSCSAQISDKRDDLYLCVCVCVFYKGPE